MSFLGIKNWLFFRRRRPWVSILTRNHIDSLDLAETRLYITNTLLEQYGLVVVDEDKDIVPTGVNLTPAQKEAMSKVAEFGYNKIGLLNAKTSKKNAGSHPSQGKSVKCY